MAGEVSIREIGLNFRYFYINDSVSKIISYHLSDNLERQNVLHVQLEMCSFNTIWHGLPHSEH